MRLWQLERQTDVWDGWTAVSTLPDCWPQSNIIAECQHYCLLPWWSSLWEHLTHMPLPIPSSFSIRQKPPLSSDIPNTFLLFLLYMRPSGYDCFIVRGSENTKAPTQNWNQTPKTHQSSFNVRTTNFGAPAPSPTFQSLVPQMIQRHCHRSPWVLRKKKETKEVSISSVFTMCLHEWDWEMGQVNNAAWGFPFHSNRKN